ncbi:MAG: helix-turn-helix domain-containing protein [Microcoleus sp. PH2017_25_DOB_D_A]|jgi:cytoskeleton protein RodZ|uniref:helix-turn-helix domain-containing protein n=1 Tax=unclassified Microcoleus TaxID=2642155 RepID=UPI001E183689|nr:MULTISPECIES: helix-turn-helix domain-containing protein [unclassified Microcoleus]TAE12047.1 MAG: helix-turn-helix domain-containing protein [Oscillatoriales cyanobacterium]MCC3491471.1 helix-turn-helix domain-containing protein [Microcoleus sp. PH2017_16_JOR_D_A]MCC3535046.1 helix-turn-helix domain-containing protein [Microcoleus sp. PH2017_25_DOB_D_A]MCC3547406.1 helix-turn-helix domain-containing protein [Microcoleus sp. PH2017_24_DOB_U_A]MCC3572777.1 helix-turn-helix domain-containing 
MALKPEAYFGVTDHATIEISQESFRSVLGQIEAELLCSDTYSQALASLQTMLGEAASAAEILIRAVSREAVKLAFDRFGKPNKTEMQVVQESVAAPSDTASYVREEEPPVPAPVFYWRSAAVEAPVTTESETENCDRDSNTLEENKEALKDEIKVDSAAPATVIAPAKSFPGFGFPKKEKKLTKEEEAALAVQEREECLRELGRELRKGRQIRSLSIQQVHSQTLVPLHHIEAIENGEIDKLPQDIYVRGFIRRLGDALGLDGTAMANALPKPAPSPIIPSTYLSASNSDSGEGFQMSPVHLYIGYTALMAGAIGGVGWLSQQPVVPGANAVEPQVTPPASVAPSPKSQEKAPQPGLKKSKSHGGMIMGADMAPPEVIFG